MHTLILQKQDVPQTGKIILDFEANYWLSSGRGEVRNIIPRRDLTTSRFRDRYIGS